MEINIITKENKKKLLDEFMSEINFSIYDKDNKYWIYMIRNSVNNKVYIGKTKNIRTRSLNYINYVLKGDCTNPLIADMIEYGISNFKIIILEIAYSAMSASIKEKYYIDKYNSIETGYNISMNSADYDRRNYKKRIPPRQTIYAKISKSKLICALDPDNKICIFSTGLKLFGDYIGKNKDDIKSYAKRQTRISGYFVYYLNKIDFDNQMKNAELKFKKNSIYSDSNDQYPIFIEYGIKLQNYLNTNKDILKDFKIYFITQDNFGYKFSNINTFFEYYNSLYNRI